MNNQQVCFSRRSFGCGISFCPAGVGTNAKGLFEMQVKCDYCGSWMEDTEDRCPNCSAANANLARVVITTPKTISQLIDWYKTRNLPPFETTRFFIGQDYKGAKAFGIYRDGDEFVVYKNKSDGSRAVRYRGKDEAYAVNEIYLRLKEEILNQKNVSQRKRSTSGTNSGMRSSGSTGSNPIGFGKGCLQWFLIAIVAMFGLAGLGALLEKVDEAKAQNFSYYLSADKQTAYYYAGYYYGDELRNTDREWWRCDVDDAEWSLYDVVTDKHHFPEGLNKENLCGEDGYLNELLDELGIERSDSATGKISPYDVQYTNAYRDLHHAAPHESAYYFVNGQSYYHLYDGHSSYGSNESNTGWYIFDDDDGWEYYCSDDDHDTIGDELWYDHEKYMIDYRYDSYCDYVSGNVYNFSDAEAAEWNSSAMATDFTDTTWYSEKADNDAAYDQYWEDHSANDYSSSDDSSSWDWSSDSDWDWDSSDSWDSGSSDWDSDW